ncbi:hypothetical protein DFH07DRAFT_959901 [Mycena maculata]|uniref:AB hydrolase-1 domain-containing protein n=1 Tax=Mycena maculata TaxID=230809 RepID=A0AAD7J1F8_9AGAR|nr:hypothetical protein DFH07DRAFT_959901 [Mycena maculata]
MDPVTQAPSGLDEDPSAYLALPRFSRTLDLDLDLAGVASRTSTVTYALTDAPPDAAWPVLIFFNGLGGHRLIAALIDGIARAHRVQILTLDKPHSGGSARGTPLPLAARTRWMHAALLAVLAHERITRVALLSHSNGLFYALYTLLHLPPGLTATSWTISGPFVPQRISGALGLRLAAALPAPLPNALGSLMQVIPPVARAASWGGGVLSLSAGLLSPAAAASTPDARERQKPAHQRGYMHRYATPRCRQEITRRMLAESRVAIGEEALFCLHGGDPTSDGADSVWGIGPGATDADVLRGAFARLVELHPDDALRIRVVYGAADGLVPARGRAWLKGVLEALGLVREEGAWTEVPGAGHDDVLFLEEVVGKILGRVQEACV